MLRRSFLITAPAAVLGACVSTDPPDSPGDACAIFRQHESWWGAVKRGERRWGAPPALVLAIIRQESGFDHNARPARGRGFLFFPGRRRVLRMGLCASRQRDVGAIRARASRRRRRSTATSSATPLISCAWYCGVSNRELGIAFTDARAQYYAYHEGHGGYRRGSHQGNDRLGAIGDRVQSYYDTYRAQLDGCEGELNRWWWPF